MLLIILAKMAETLKIPNPGVQKFGTVLKALCSALIFWWYDFAILGLRSPSMSFRDCLVNAVGLFEVVESSLQADGSGCSVRTNERRGQLCPSVFARPWKPLLAGTHIYLLPRNPRIVFFLDTQPKLR